MDLTTRGPSHLFDRTRLRWAPYPPNPVSPEPSGSRVNPDAELRVRGVDGLRVADASVMPYIVNANTNFPSIMIGEKCAELLRPRPA